VLTSAETSAALHVGVAGARTISGISLSCSAGQLGGHLQQGTEPPDWFAALGGILQADLSLATGLQRWLTFPCRVFFGSPFFATISA
jgi:hypothetical protein